MLPEKVAVLRVEAEDTLLSVFSVHRVESSPGDGDGGVAAAERFAPEFARPFRRPGREVAFLRRQSIPMIATPLRPLARFGRRTVLVGVGRSLENFWIIDIVR